MASNISPPKPSDHRDQCPIPSCLQPNDKKLQNLVSEHDCHGSVPIWLHGLIDNNSPMKSNYPIASQLFAAKNSSSNAGEGPDLELKLSGPKPNQEKNKSSQGHLLVGPITVT